MSNTAYITALGKFLPGEPVGNEQMEDHLGRIGGKASRLRARILKQNGIRSRHYAIDREGAVIHVCCDCEIAVVIRCRNEKEIGEKRIDIRNGAASLPDAVRSVIS